MLPRYRGSRRFVRASGPLVLVLFAGTVAGSARADGNQPVTSVPPSIAVQQAALAAPPPTHLALAPGDVAAPGKQDGGPAMPPPPDLPQMISLDDALRMFRAHGFGLLIADAAVSSAQGVEKSAGAVPNPQLTLGYGRIVDPAFGPACGDQFGCSSNQYTAGLSDNAGIEDGLSGKRHLRIKVAKAALAAARLNRVDAQRTLEFQVKSAYFQVVQARAAYEFSNDLRQASEHELDLNQERLNSGKINEGDFERIRQTMLEAEQAVDTAFQDLRQAKIALSFLLGVRGRVPDFDVDKDALKFSVPPPLATSSADGLLREAFSKRPDLLALGFQEQRARGAIALARRQRFPDVALGVQYTQTGWGNPTASPIVQPPTLSFTLTGNLPVFYQQQGEILQAQSDFATQQLSRGQTAAQVVSDVESAYAGYLGARSLVQRMESALLASARRALDITKIQWLAGKANLTDYLQARTAFIQTSVEYQQDLTSYWTAVAQLEAAVGTELRQ